MNILFGSVTGTAENVARSAAKIARDRGHDVHIKELDEISMEELAEMDDVLVFIATYGEGEMPFNAETFWDELEFQEPVLQGLTYGVLALGDTAYEQFCQAGKDIDHRFAELGAIRRVDRVDCDLNYEKDAEAWIDRAIPKKGEAIAIAAPAPASAAEPDPEPRRWSRTDPFPSRLLENTRLSGAGSTKAVHHIAVDVTGSGFDFAPGDSIGVITRNNADLVSAMLDRLQAQANDTVEGYDLSLGALLETKFEILTPSLSLVQAVAGVIADEGIKAAVAAPKEELDAYLWGKDVIDILNIDPRLQVGTDILLGLLQPLQHRAYSIASSPVTQPDKIDLTVATVAWERDARRYRGVCSTQLNAVTPIGGQVDIFMIPFKKFRLPEDPATPVIMIGPGTGIAPFMGFLEERQAAGATGESWLYFGDRNAAHDFIYRDRLHGYHKNGALTHLRTVFSRDGNSEKYVQDLLRQDAKAIFAAMEAGGVIYICGDAKRMAVDVETALTDIIMAGQDTDQAGANRYMSDLRRAGRLLKDVY
ncbi:MAG: sulfite reductase flavoprotein subunit alpha [Pseudomonadota bacterium]